MVKRDFIRDIILFLLFVGFLIGLRIFVFDFYKIKETNANSYLQTDDVVVISRPEEPGYKDFVLYKADGKKQVGRIIGLPGQSITYMDDIFYLDTMVEPQDYLDTLKHRYLKDTGGQMAFTSDFTIETLTDGQYETVPDGYYLILNDNRQNTADSREFGLIPKKAVKGKITFRLLPLEEFGFVDVE